MSSISWLLVVISTCQVIGQKHSSEEA